MTPRARIHRTATCGIPLMSENAKMSTMADASRKLNNRETMTPGRGKMVCMPWRERIAELANPNAEIGRAHV